MKIDESDIREKMASGLTREAAIQVLDAQARHDATNPHDTPSEDKPKAKAKAPKADKSEGTEETK